MFWYVCVGEGSVLKRIFECLGFAIAHCPAGSKIIHGQRKGWPEKPLTNADSEGLPILGSKEKILQINSKRKIWTLRKIACLSSTATAPLHLAESRSLWFTFSCCYFYLSFFKTFLTLPVCVESSLPIFPEVITQMNRMLQRWFIAHSVTVPLKKRETILQAAKANIELHKCVFKSRKCHCQGCKQEFNSAVSHRNDETSSNCVTKYFQVRWCITLVLHVCSNLHSSIYNANRIF